MPRRFLWLSLCIAALLSACNLPSLPLGRPQPTPLVATEPVVADTTPLAQSPTPDGPALGPPLRVEQDGYSVRFPAGWLTRQLSTTLTIAASADGLGRTSPGPDLVVSIDATPLGLITDQYGAEAARDPTVFFELSSGRAQEAGYTISPTLPITVSNVQGLAADLSSAGGSGQLVVLLGPTHAVRLLGQASPEAWASQRPIFEAIVASLSFFAPLVVPTPTPLGQAVQPPMVTEGPPGFVLRLGGSDGPPGGRFDSARGLAAAPDGTIYLAESNKGIWVFNPDGTLARTFGSTDLLDAYDVAFSPDGDLFVADYGRSTIVQFTQAGELVKRWGSVGEGNEQFGVASPQRIALGLDGVIYALDSRLAESGGALSSVMRFRSADGSFIDRLTLPEGSAPADIAVDGQGNIYLAETLDATIVKLDPQGAVLGRFGGAVVEGGIVAGALDVDRLGNIYVASWNAGILKLSPQGLVVARGGSVAEPNTIPEPGQFVLPNGIVAAPGGVVWVSDKSGVYSALTALRLAGDAEAQATAEAQAAAETAQAAGRTPEATGEPSLPTDGLVRQWASSATASSSYGDEYGPDGATGPPNVVGCMDSPDAWASSDPNGLETLELRFEQPVFAVQVNVHQNNQPGYISQIELIDARGTATVVYQSQPKLSESCPLVLSATFNQTEAQIVAVRLTVDQRSGANWSEVDAVELVGVE
jgi:streptogramin lyase